MLVLFQEGIPDIFFNELNARGISIVRFSTAADAAAICFAKHAAAEAIFFRANFILSPRLIDLLPRVRLAALVSTGTDNLDVTALSERGIQLTTGDGANARAVFDYVVQALCYGGFDFMNDRLGVVGAGRVGSHLLRFFEAIGRPAAFFDPLLEKSGSLGAVLQCDVVSFHVPLSDAGPFATRAMLNAEYFAPAKKNIRIIQTCRGAIWNDEFYHSGKVNILAQDVYPCEPPPWQDLQLASYSTPHIAGYSTRGRLGGILKGIAALVTDFAGEGALPEGRAWHLKSEADAFAAAPQAFNGLRDGYAWRKEFSEYDAQEQAEFVARFPAVPGQVYKHLFRR